MKQSANGEEVRLVVIGGGFPQYIASHRLRVLGPDLSIRLVLLHQNQLESLSQSLRNQLFEHFLSGQGTFVAPGLRKIRVYAVRRQSVQGHHVVRVQGAFVRKIVCGDGKTRWDGQRLPVHT